LRQLRPELVALRSNPLQVGARLVALETGFGRHGVEHLEPVASVGELDPCLGGRSFGILSDLESIEQLPDSLLLGEKAFSACEVRAQQGLVPPFGLGQRMG
jgi:hypothetical protein